MQTEHPTTLLLKKIVLLLGIVLLNSFGAVAQGYSESGQNTQDSTYVRSMRDYLSLRIYSIIKTTDFSIRNNNLNRRFQFRPDNGLGIGLGFAYKILALDLGFVIPGTSRYKGDEPTIKFDLLSTLYGKKHVFDVNVQYYEGYYLNNASDFFPNGSDPALAAIRPDIKSIDLGLSYLNVMNHDKFSFQAAFLGDKIQQKSAGSLTFHGFISVYGLEADSLLVLNDFSNDLNQQAHINQIALLSTGTGIGYAHTFVLPKHFFITLSGAPMIMATNGTVEVNNPQIESSESLGVNFRLHTRNAIGYNAKRFYLIFNIIYDNNFVGLKQDTRFEYAPLKMKLFFGYRVGKLK